MLSVQPAMASNAAPPELGNAAGNVPTPFPFSTSARKPADLSADIADTDKKMEGADKKIAVATKKIAGADEKMESAAAKMEIGRAKSASGAAKMESGGPPKVNEEVAQTVRPRSGDQASRRLAVSWRTLCPMPHAVLSVLGPDRAGALYHALRYLQNGPAALDITAAAHAAVAFSRTGAIPIARRCAVSGLWVRVVQPMGIIMLRFEAPDEATLKWLKQDQCLEVLANEINSVPSPYGTDPMRVAIHAADPPEWIANESRHFVIRIGVSDSDALMDNLESVLWPLVRSLREEFKDPRAKFESIEIHSADYVHSQAGFCDLIVRVFVKTRTSKLPREQTRTYLEQAVARAGKEAFGPRLLPPTERQKHRVGFAPDAIPYLRSVISHTDEEVQRRAGGIVIMPLHVLAKPGFIEDVVHCPAELGQGPTVRAVARWFGDDAIAVVAARRTEPQIGEAQLSNWCSDNRYTPQNDGTPLVSQNMHSYVRASADAPSPGQSNAAPMSIWYKYPKTEPGRLLEVLEMLRRFVSPRVGIMSADGLWTKQEKGGKGFSGQLTFGLPRTLSKQTCADIKKEIKTWMDNRLERDRLSMPIGLSKNHWKCDVEYDEKDFAS